MYVGSIRALYITSRSHLISITVASHMSPLENQWANSDDHPVLVIDDYICTGHSSELIKPAWSSQEVIARRPGNKLMPMAPYKG